MTVYHPIVFWGQSKEHILLSIRIKNAKNVSVDIQDESLIFKAVGEGASGEKPYSFEIKYYLPVLPKESSWKVKEIQVEIKLKKELKDPWPRLSACADKLPWLKCDFNNFFFDESDDSYESNYESNNEKVKPKLKKPLMDSISKGEKFFNDVTKPLNLYLIMFNLFQYAGYLYTFGACLWVIYRHGYSNGRLKVFPLIKDQLVTVQVVSIGEFIHAWLGWVKSSPKMAFLQIFGRNFVLLCIVLPNELLHTDPEFFWLAISWSAIEIVRYPFYLLTLLGENVAFLTWLRYTVWVPLYPFGFMAEGKLILKSIPLFEKSNKFSIFLPNPLNIQFNFSTFLYIYIPVIVIGFYFLMRRMYEQRKRKIGPTVTRDWSKYNFLQFLVETFGPKAKGKTNKMPKSLMGNGRLKLGDDNSHIKVA